MKFSVFATLSLIAAPVAAEVYFKEQFNDEVSLFECKKAQC
jgi:hypothetical protein